MGYEIIIEQKDISTPLIWISRLYDAAFENGGSSQSLTTADCANYSLDLTGTQSLAYPVSAASRSEGEFTTLVRDCVSEWRDRLYECPATDDPHFLTFHQYEPKVHEPVRIAMVEDARRQQEAEDDQVSPCVRQADTSLLFSCLIVLKILLFTIQKAE